MKDILLSHGGPYVGPDDSQLVHREEFYERSGIASLGNSGVETDESFSSSGISIDGSSLGTDDPQSVHLEEFDGGSGIASLGNSGVEREESFSSGDISADVKEMSLDGDDVYSVKSIDSFDFDSSESETEEDHDSLSQTKTTFKRFDANLIVESIQYGESVLEVVKGKDIVLVVGKTGTGKSTLIQAIAGRKFHEVEHLYTIRKRSECTDAAKKIVYEAIDPLPGFEIGHAKASKTTTFACFNKSSFKSGSGNDLLFVDSPGFEDTGGQEADIATSVMLSQFAKYCHSLRFIIMISYVSLLEDRGGSMRSVLRLIRSFTKDFNQEKKSFMFLFTHSNEIAGVPDSIEGAKTSVKNEIIQMIDGTTDEETKVVLDFIHKSFKRGYPFVNVFLPLKTNANNLIQDVAKSIKPLNEPYLAKTCGLTQSSRLMLSGETRNQLQELRQKLKEKDISMDGVFAILKVFRYFEHYINTEDIRMVTREADNLLRHFIIHQKKTIEDEMIKGTYSEYNFGVANVATIKVSLMRLQALELHYPDSVEYAMIESYIEQMLNEFEKQLMIDHKKNLEGVCHQLSKMSTWSCEFPKFSAHYERVKNHLEKLIQESVAKCTSVDTDLLNLSPEQLELHIKNIVFLHSVYQEAESLIFHTLDAKRASSIYETAVQKIQSNIIAWERYKISDIKESFLDDSKIFYLTKLLASIDCLNRLLKKYPVCMEQRNQVEALQKQFLEYITEAYEELVATLNIDEVQQSTNFPSTLKHLQLISELLSSVGDGIFRKILLIYNELVHKIKAQMMKKQGELNQITNLVNQEGIKNGVEDAQMLKCFKNMHWFDAFLPEEEKFIQNYSIQFDHVYSERGKFMKSEVHRLIHYLDDQSSDSDHVTGELKTLFIEIEQLSLFANVLKKEDLSLIEVDTRKKLQEFIESFIMNNKNCVTKWQDIALDMKSHIQIVEARTKRLEDILRKATSLKELVGPWNNALNSLFNEVIRGLNSFSEKVHQVIESSEKYIEKRYLLQIAGVLGRFPNVAKYVPNEVVLQKLARNAIASDAKKIEDLVSQSSEWDIIDEHISKFEDALTLDCFTSNEASSRVYPLRKLREQKQEEVENLLEKLIDDEDFKGVREFLVPYGESKDQVKRKKFKKWCDMISSSLTRTVAIVEHNIEGYMSAQKCEGVVKNMQKLENAHVELKKILNFPGNLNLGREMYNTKNKINRKINALIDRFEIAFKNHNYEDMGINKNSLEIFISSPTNMKKIIYKNQLTRIEKVMRNYETAVKNVSKFMKRFVESRFQESFVFFKTLSSLKSATNRTSSELNDLEVLYRDTTKALTKQLNQVVEDMCKNVSMNKCYGDAISIMTPLDGHLTRTLKYHIVVSDLSFNSGELSKEWREEKRRLDFHLEFNIGNAKDKLKEWKSLLDKLKPYGKYAWNWYSGSMYQEKKREIEMKKQNCFITGKKALKENNHPLLQENINLLNMIESYLGQHISSMEWITKLQQNAVVAFLDLCDHSQRVLQSKQKMKFQVVFDNYRGFVLNLPCILANEKCQRAFSLTNQLIHDAMKNAVEDIALMRDKLSFEKLKIKVQGAREFGEFIADHCTLLTEEMRRCSHIIAQDKWLEEIFNICQKHFSCGRSYEAIKYFAILELTPSANDSEIEKSYRRLAKKYHPDKTGSKESSDFRLLTEAKEKLLCVIKSRYEAELPFSAFIAGLGTFLREEVRKHLEEQHYEQVEKILFRLVDLKVLKSLISPDLDHREITEDIHKLVRSHVSQVKTTVNSYWSSRNYSALNDTIDDLKLMEEKFKSYEDIFPSSWDSGIIKAVEQEIECLGRRAREYLSSQISVNENLDDFRRCFLDMGHVLVELPMLKDFTKSVMCSVLETCLGTEWGYSFLFKFGLGLQKDHENGNEKDTHVAQILVAEFSHFKEVMTMVWNEETSQKPAEDTVHDIKGHRRIASKEVVMEIDKDFLLQSFHIFEIEYKKMLGEYIDPEADLRALVYKTIDLAEELCPLDLNSDWNKRVKEKLPFILAGVFTVFTVLKSGASYNRLDSTTENGTDIGEKLLMKPHNIQVLTLLTLFGCSSSSASGLHSQLMQIRTGEGKSMILGAAAVVIALLGYRVRCVCYSEYLSCRDFNLFRDVFDIFSVTELVKYSKITTLSEDSTAAKGDIRNLTEALLRGKLEQATLSIDNKIYLGIESSKTDQKTSSSNEGKEIVKRSMNTYTAKCASQKEFLLVDEVDVFFGSDFYGQTYNQVFQLREPEIADILKHVWAVHKQNGGRRQRIVDIQSLPAYVQLLKKMPQFQFLIDAEISLMIDQVRKVDEEPHYHLDQATDRIGYKVMDSISYEATYGYRTVFAYLKEAEKGNLKNKDSTLDHTLAIPVSCGQFSYADISPERILGVSGTLSALGDYEYDVLAKYGVETFLYVPSVYGESNFQFDKAGEGIRIDTSKSDYFHSITDQIHSITKLKRSVIVFFQDNERLKEYTSSSFYRKLGRHKKLLTEEMSPADKEFSISKAATSGQITITTAIFGRGTDFFCKDETIQRNGGVHVIQAFFSEEQSEEIQIQGRTARQGKKGSYQLILLESDLQSKFHLKKGIKDNIAKDKWYQELCTARDKFRQNCYALIEKDLTDATQKDKATHMYFDSLLEKNKITAMKRFEDIYLTFKKGLMPSSIEIELAFLIDVTGSMAPYSSSIVKTVISMLKGTGSITEKLKAKFPDVAFHLRVGIMGYRDIDDDPNQFSENIFKENCHFSDSISSATQFVESITKSSSGGGDIAEDHLGAIERCANWNSANDWTSPVKFILLFTDAPAHGMVPEGSKGVSNVDNYSVRHPDGLTTQNIIDCLIEKDIDLFICSFNPDATAVTEKELSMLYKNHPENTDQREITSIPMVSVKSDILSKQDKNVEVLGGHGKHIVFVLDMSGSMNNSWNGVVDAYNKYIVRRRQNQHECDLVSVVQFESQAQISVSMVLIGQAPNSLSNSGGGTAFAPAAQSAYQLASSTPTTHIPTVVFMSDGGASDASDAANTFAQLNRDIRQIHNCDLELHVIAFGRGACMSQLQQITNSSPNGKLHTSADTAELSSIFVQIAGGENVTQLLEAEIGKRISDAVLDRLSLEYLA